MSQCKRLSTWACIGNVWCFFIGSTLGPFDATFYDAKTFVVFFSDD